MKKTIILSLILLPILVGAVSYVNNVNGDDGTITCSPSVGSAKCRVNQFSNFMFGGINFGIDTGSYTEINPSILWRTNDMPMFMFGADGSSGAIKTLWDSTNKYIKTETVSGDAVPSKVVLRSPNGSCHELQVDNYGTISTQSIPCN